ncbi:MAG: hypothetical protein RAK22_00255 [Nanoarchaeota archaeon]|nr:hypothetical protein [Nanoarchaeota archaeon]
MQKIISNAMREQIAIEYLVKKFNRLGVSSVKIDKTPLGIKVVIFAYKPNLIISRYSNLLKEASSKIGQIFNTEPPRIDVEGVENPLLDPEIVADSIAFNIFRFGPMKYKVIAHKALDNTMKAGARGAEIEIGGVLKERAAHFKFRPNGGVLPKSGQVEQYGVRKASKQLLLKRGMIGIKVTIVTNKPMPGEVRFKDGGETGRSGDGTSEDEHKENTGAPAS